MDKTELKTRTKAFGLRVLKLVRHLPRDLGAGVVGKQLVRSALSVGANYRSACRGRSKAEFLAKLGIVEEEADESSYWMELLIESGMISEPLVRDLLAECNEITAMVVSSIRTTRANQVETRNSERGVRK